MAKIRDGGSSLAKSKGRCSCGAIRFAAYGAPIATVACHCDDCQQAARELGLTEGIDGQGSEFVLYHRNRLEWLSGEERLHDHRLDGRSSTLRAVASCCGSFLMIRFDDSRHWVSIHRSRLDPAKPLQWRICTRFEPDPKSIPADVPAFRGYPVRFLGRLLLSSLGSAAAAKARRSRKSATSSLDVVG